MQWPTKSPSECKPLACQIWQRPRTLTRARLVPTPKRIIAHRIRESDSLEFVITILPGHVSISSAHVQKLSTHVVTNLGVRQMRVLAIPLCQMRARIRTISKPNSILRNVRIVLSS
jgi:hypothetical protein